MDAIKVLFLLHVGALDCSTTLSSQCADQCRVLSACPSPEAWNNRRLTRNCGKNKTYHCIRTETSQLCELCLRPMLIHKDQIDCPTIGCLNGIWEFAKSVRCPNSTAGCPDKNESYMSDQLFKFPGCTRLQQTTRASSYPARPVNITKPHKSSRFISTEVTSMTPLLTLSENNTESRAYVYIALSITAVLATTILLILTIIGLLLLKRKMRKENVWVSYRKNEEDTDVRDLYGNEERDSTTNPSPPPVTTFQSPQQPTTYRDKTEEQSLMMDPLPSPETPIQISKQQPFVPATITILASVGDLCKFKRKLDTSLKDCQWCRDDQLITHDKRLIIHSSDVESVLKIESIETTDFSYTYHSKIGEEVQMYKFCLPKEPTVQPFAQPFLDEIFKDWKTLEKATGEIVDALRAVCTYAKSNEDVPHWFKSLVGDIIDKCRETVHDVKMALSSIRLAFISIQSSVDSCIETGSATEVDVDKINECIKNCKDRIDKSVSKIQKTIEEVKQQKASGESDDFQPKDEQGNRDALFEQATQLMDKLLMSWRCSEQRFTDMENAMTYLLPEIKYLLDRKDEMAILKLQQIMSSTNQLLKTSKEHEEYFSSVDGKLSNLFRQCIRDRRNRLDNHGTENDDSASGNAVDLLRAISLH